MERTEPERSVLFDPVYYLRANPEVAAAGADPWEHYRSTGWKNGRRPHLLFDVKWYLARYSAVVTEPLQHYLSEGWRLNYQPHPLFDPEWYREQSPAATEEEPLGHYLQTGWKQGLSPHPLFDAADYLKKRPGLLEADKEPLQHYLTSGWKKGIQPHPLFALKWYLDKYPDVRETGKEPLQHYLKAGWKEGRQPHPLFNPKYYVANAAVEVGKINPLLHFLRIGGLTECDPNPAFSILDYLTIFPELRKLRVNPLVHYLRNRVEKETAPEFLRRHRPWDAFSVKSAITQREDISAECERGAVDVIVCIHNALEDVQACLKSLKLHRTPDTTILLVNDGSDSATTRYLENFCATTERVELVSSPTARGYTKAVNQGLSRSTAPFCILLNSDTIVSEGWINRLVQCSLSSARIGLAGPVSNCATWQSVPEVTGRGGGWALNPLPEGSTVDEMARLVTRFSQSVYPRVPLLNGFCLLIRREVFDAVGSFDEAGFPLGYGEENDFCLRARQAGYELAVAEDCYVYHAKSKSYSSAGRKPLVEAGKKILRARYGKETFDAAACELRENPILRELRGKIKQATDRRPAWPAHFPAANPRILYLLLCSGHGGGIVSVLQEAYGMVLRGYEVRVAVFQNHMDGYLDHFAEFPEEMFVMVKGSEDLSALAGDYSIVIGTIFTSVRYLAEIVRKCSRVLPAYYIQDYEPFFCEEGSAQFYEAEASYTLVPGTVCFAKTTWLCELVRDKVSVAVNKVLPSIDHSIFYPDEAPRGSDVLTVCAMVRPRTPRRAAKETIAVLRLLKQHFQEQVNISIFGTSAAELFANALEPDFEHENHGVLRRRGLAQLLRNSDLFIDMSSYQAFGRTAAEAMACGCAVAVPQNCGTSEFAVHDVNALVVDTSDIQGTADQAIRLLENRTQLELLRKNGIQAVRNYTISGAVDSILDLLLREHRRCSHAAA